MMPHYWINAEQLSVDGAGPPLVCIHDLGDTSHTWLPVSVPLSRTFAVVRYDLRGCGRSDHPPAVDAAPDLSTLVGDLADLLDVLGLSSAHLAGHGLGGVIAQRLAFGAPARVRTLILEGTAPAPLAEITGALGAGEGTTSVAEKPWVARSRPAVEPQLLGAIECPALVVVGELDDAPFQHGAELLHGWMPNSRLVRIADAGHTPHVERPARFVEHARAFLAEHEPSLRC